MEKEFARLLAQMNDEDKRAMRAMEKRRLLCTCNWFTKLQHLLHKLAPNPLLIRMWLAMCGKK